MVGGSRKGRKAEEAKKRRKDREGKVGTNARTKQPTCSGSPANLHAELLHHGGVLDVRGDGYKIYILILIPYRRLFV